jgi:hypothetical protein
MPSEDQSHPRRHVASLVVQAQMPQSASAWWRQGQDASPAQAQASLTQKVLVFGGRGESKEEQGGARRSKEEQGRAASSSNNTTTTDAKGTLWNGEGPGDRSTLAACLRTCDRLIPSWHAVNTKSSGFTSTRSVEESAKNVDSLGPMTNCARIQREGEWHPG